MRKLLEGCPIFTSPDFETNKDKLLVLLQVNYSIFCTLIAFMNNHADTNTRLFFLLP